MSSEILNSPSEDGEVADLATVVAEFPDGDDKPNQIPVKKLSGAFAGCVKDSGMKVYLRVRPIPSRLESTIVVDNDTTITTTAPESSKRALYTKTEERHYTFTKVFGPLCEQTQVFDQSIHHMLEKFLHGESCVLFAYGMTNAGKTHTIQGSTQDPGVLPRLVNAVLLRLAQTSHHKKHSPASSSHASAHAPEPEELSISMLEIYQEKIFDLLAKKKEKLTIRDTNGKVEVPKLTSQPLFSAQEAMKLMDTASGRRTKSNTLLNAVSSRSHAVYTLTLRRGEGETIFHLVDLAGAERGNRTKATAAQQKEANTINMSLMQLWRCLQGMKKSNPNPSTSSSSSSSTTSTTSSLSSSGQVQVSHPSQPPSDSTIIPFRESKLTHLLMPQLGRCGLGGVTMMVCVNPLSEDYDETLSILTNASLAVKIKEFSDLSLRSTAQATTFAPQTNGNVLLYNSGLLAFTHPEDNKEKEKSEEVQGTKDSKVRKRPVGAISTNPNSNPHPNPSSVSSAQPVPTAPPSSIPGPSLVVRQTLKSQASSKQQIQRAVQMKHIPPSAPMVTGNSNTNPPAPATSSIPAYQKPTSSSYSTRSSKQSASSSSSSTATISSSSTNSSSSSSRRGVGTRSQATKPKEIEEVEEKEKAPLEEIQEGEEDVEEVEDDEDRVEEKQRKKSRAEDQPEETSEGWEAQEVDEMSRPQLRAAVNALQQRCSELEEENDYLRRSQSTRETEIRAEVSEEMMQTTSVLLSQISSMQSQLSQQENSAMRFDITKSSKKARKQILQLASEDTARSLQEAEEELERARSTHGKEIETLRGENRELMKEVEKWKTLSTKPGQGVSFAPSPSISASSSPTTRSPLSPLKIEQPNQIISLPPSQAVTKPFPTPNSAFPPLSPTVNLKTLASYQQQQLLQEEERSRERENKQQPFALPLPTPLSLAPVSGAHSKSYRLRSQLR